MSGVLSPARVVATPEESAGWSDLLDLVRQDEVDVILETAGKPVAVLIPFEEYRRLTDPDAARRDLFAAIDRMQDAFTDVSPNEIEREIASAIAEVRRDDGGG